MITELRPVGRFGPSYRPDSSMKRTMSEPFLFRLAVPCTRSYNRAVAGMTLNHDAGPVSPIEEETICKAQHSAFQYPRGPLLRSRHEQIKRCCSGCSSAFHPHGTYIPQKLPSLWWLQSEAPFPDGTKAVTQIAVSIHHQGKQLRACH
jgi:hypothetical protein